MCAFAQAPDLVSVGWRLGFELRRPVRRLHHFGVMPLHVAWMIAP
ncbi:hypothetical protein SynBIOSE41_01590 [Synechococcus sp. BIOS-E4-1]|nr:hypothetical protein SynBIOSE41_01590 [Synechococcus sp. BIOS-E4-1]